MELKSVTYVIFAIVVIVSYFLVYKIKNAQKYVILLSNLFFIYAVSGIRSLIIIMGLTLISYLYGNAIEKNILNGKKNTARLLMWLSVITSVLILCYFKFFKESFELLRKIMFAHGIAISSLITPIGISYYTLTMMSYAIDIYHKKYKAESNYADYLVFITYFPSIVEGPINLYRKVAYQLKESHRFEWNQAVMGMQRMLWGYMKKVVIADRIGILVTSILRDESTVGFTLFWAMVLYSIQIYADFSGGIDVIMGLSEVLGIKLAENFRSPLISKSVTEYWQRWHMSLGEFMEKYIYYPIVLNRRVMKFSKKIPNTYLQKVFSATLASVIVFVIVGIWHGTGWNYVVYGCYQALFVSSAVLLSPFYKKLINVLHIHADSISWNLFRLVRTFVILTFGRYFIRANNLSQALELIGKTFTKFKLSGIHILFDDSLCNYGLDYKNVILMYAGILLMIVVDVIHERKIHIRETIMKQDIVFRYAIYMAAVFSIIIFGIYGLEYDSASFIYAGF